MSDTTINLCENIILKSVKMHLSGYTEILGFLKFHSFFHRGQNSFFFNLYSRDCEEPI